MKFGGVKHPVSAIRERRVRHIWRIAGAIITGAAMTLSFGNAANAQARQPASEGPSQQHRADQGRSADTREPIDIPAVSIDDALTIVREHPSVVDELLVAGKGIVGGIVPDPALAPRRQARDAKLAFRNTFGVVPVVRGFVAQSDASSSKIDRAQERFEAADRASARRAPVPETTGSADDVDAELLGLSDVKAQFELIQAQDIPEHFPSFWKGVMYPASYQVQEPQRIFDYQFSYGSATGANPQLIPEDWGLELGVTTWNFDIAGSGIGRPNCGFDGTDSNTDFWQKNYTTGATWMTNLPPASVPYLDTNVATDSCQANSVEIGIGYPRQLTADTTYRAAVYLGAGTKEASPFSASAQLVSNDCNDAWLEPSTNCMGLNFDRTPDGGIDQSQTYVNIDRGWSVPGCAAMADGWAGPQYTASGTGGCPSADGSSNVAVSPADVATDRRGPRDG